MVFGLQAIFNGDPDLYINYDNNQLPDKDLYDFKSTEAGSEFFVLDLKNEYFKYLKQTIKGKYAVAIYGKKESSFVFSVTENKYPIIPLTSGVQFRASQAPYETRLFKF